MVWLHGGGFSNGSANEADYDGEALSRSGDVVVVSVSHRLNVFGYLDLSAYGEKYQYSANVGMMDIVAALEWIQDNIEAFGGDPDNVTVFGQSGGGAKVLALMSSPYAEGLFDKGIVQSGATETMGVRFNTQESSTRLTEHILDILGITGDNIEDIQTVPAEELEAASAQALAQAGEEMQIPASLGGGYSMDWEPVVDGDFLPTDPVTEDSFAEAGAQISQAWINFARTGTPGAQGLPEWEPYTRESGATMLLDTESELVYHHDQELMSLLAPDYVY